MKMLNYLHNNILSLNNSKYFAGIMILILNIGSRILTLKFNGTSEKILKMGLTRQIIIFSIAWMGTRDIYSSFVLTAVFIFLSDYLFNEDSKLCVIPEKYRALKDEIDTNKDGIISTDELNRAIELIKIANNKMAAKL